MNMRKLAAGLLSACLLFLSGCGDGIALYRDAYNLEDLSLIRTIGIDAKDGSVRLSVSTGQPVTGEISPVRLTAEAKSVSLAMEAVQDYSNSEALIYDHVSYILLGEEAAKDAARYLDYLERNSQVRRNTPIFVVRNGTAEDLVMEAGGDASDITAIMDSLVRSLKNRGNLQIISYGDVLQNLSESGTALCSAIRCQKNKGTGEGIIAMPEGYAILLDGKECGFLTGDGAYGVSLLQGHAGTGVVELSSGACVELTSSKVKMDPVVDGDGNLSELRFTVNVTAELLELEEPGTVSTPAALRALGEELASVTSGWTAYVFRAQKDAGADFLGIWRTLTVRHPFLWNRVSQNWRQVMTTVPFSVTTSGEVIRARNTNSSISYDGGGQNDR